MSAPARAAASAQILERLKRLHPKEIDLDLARIERLLARLGNPERRLPPVVHVAGTNGKGSTCAFLRAILEAEGWRVHVYTSPHLVRFHERIRLAGSLISEGELLATLDEVERANEGQPLTFFEATTAAAFLAMARHPADACILEVGMGGRLDATNVVARPAACALAPIDVDHREYLGGTRARIALEKAGIMKRGVVCAVGPQEDDVRAAIERRAAEIEAPLVIFGQDFRAYEEHGRMIYTDERGLLDLPLPRLMGRHQIENAGLAVAVLRHGRGIGVSDMAVERGMRTVEWPARLQRLTRGPLFESAPEGADLWLDGGHNAHAAAALARALADLEDKDPRPLYLVVGMLKTKDPMAFLAHFRGLARHVTTIGIAGEDNAHGAGALYDLARQAGLSADPAESIADAFAQIEARTQIEGGTPPRIVICGSLYLAGRVLAENV